MFGENLKQEKLDQELSKKLVAIGMPVNSFPTGTGIHYIDHFGNNCEETRTHYDCPLEEALKWFRDCKHIHINPGQYTTLGKDGTKHLWGYAIVETTGEHRVLNDGNPDNNYNRYEDAAIAGIKWVLANVAVTMTVAELREALKDAKPEALVTDVIGSGLVKVEINGKGVVLNFAGDK
jgi:hypothetical protein